MRCAQYKRLYTKSLYTNKQYFPFLNTDGKMITILISARDQGISGYFMITGTFRRLTNEGQWKKIEAGFPFLSHCCEAYLPSPYPTFIFFKQIIMQEG